MFGTPPHVAERLRSFKETLGLSGLITEADLGGRMPPEFVSGSVRLFGQEMPAGLDAAAG